MNTQYQRDILMGDQVEAKVHRILKKKFPKIVRTDTYHPIDFIDKQNKIIYELKYRNINKDRYNETLMPLSKILYAQKYPDYTFVLLFQFTDGLYYLEWSDEVTHRIDTFVRNPASGRVDQPKQYVFIGVDQLQKYE